MSQCPVWTEKLLCWYDQVKRDLPWRRTKNPYAIWISEVMLQQTQVKTVIPYYESFLQRFPTIRSLALAELDDVLEVWRGLGYYSRAKHLWEGARFVLEKWGGTLPPGYEELLEIPGVGAYTAGAIASIAFQERVPAVDGNVNRVLARFLAWVEPPQKVKSRGAFQKLLEEWLPQDRPGDFNQALMELGATLCTPKLPRCGECPFRAGCRAHQIGAEAFFPVKQAQLHVAEALRPTLVIYKGDRILLAKRPAQGLLANLWELPGEEIFFNSNSLNFKELNFSLGTPWNTLNVDGAVGNGRSVTEISHEIHEKAQNYLNGPDYWFGLFQRVVKDRSFDQEVRKGLEQGFVMNGPVQHTFSHRRWEMVWVPLEWPGEVMKQGICFSFSTWAQRGEIEKMALPVAFQKVIEKLKLT